MIGSVEKKPSVRIAGYLEKRGKMRLLVCRWKRWWFVLEGRLLLYYKSQLEYLNLSPCRGSLNMGLAASVRPGKGLELTVITRSQTVTLECVVQLKGLLVQFQQGSQCLEENGRAEIHLQLVES
ncbi:hypothetical protein J6590_105707 [Homalodisca vitripennis]|nr:hypothetical protein J6590_105707 [Homalodisca vitripennis]